MKTILLPTDFSSHSEKALEFAIEIVKLTDAEILVSHAYQVPIYDPNIPTSMMETISDEEYNYAKEKLEVICQRISKQVSGSGKKLQSKYIAENNSPTSEIYKQSEENKVDLIIMGTESKEDFFSLSLGSITENVVNRVNCPVLVVKKDTPYNYFQKIFYAVENLTEDIITLQQLIPFAKIFNSEITLLHVSEYATTIEELAYNNAKEEAQNKILNSIKDSLQYSNIGIRYCFADEVVAGFLRITNSAHPDLITLLKYNRGWIENIFHKSIIKQEIKNSKIPLLILHK